MEVKKFNANTLKSIATTNLMKSILKAVVKRAAVAEAAIVRNIHHPSIIPLIILVAGLRYDQIKGELVDCSLSSSSSLLLSSLSLLFFKFGYLLYLFCVLFSSFVQKTNLKSPNSFPIHVLTSSNSFKFIKK